MLNKHKSVFGPGEYANKNVENSAAFVKGMNKSFVSGDVIGR